MNANFQEDIELLQGIRQNDAGAFRQLFDRYWQLLFRLAASKIGHAQDAEDIVQELFIELWRKKEPLVLSVRLQSYLVSCIYLKIFQYFKKKGFQEKIVVIPHVGFRTSLIFTRINLIWVFVHPFRHKVFLAIIAVVFCISAIFSSNSHNL